MAFVVVVVFKASCKIEKESKNELKDSSNALLNSILVEKKE